MPSGEIKLLREADRLIAQGNMEQASKILRDLYSASNSAMKLECAARLVVTLDRNTQNAELIRYSEEGIQRAREQKNDHVLACMLASKAMNLNIGVCFLIYRTRGLTLLAPGWTWLGFSLESEETEYKELMDKIKRNDTECDELLDRAVSISANRPTTKAFVLSLKGEVYCGKRTNYMLSNSKWSKLANLFRYCRPIKNWLINDEADRLELKRLLSISLESLIEAENLYRQCGQPGEAASAILSRAVVLTDAFQFREANKLVPILKEYCDQIHVPGLKIRIARIEERIRTRNKCIPNYVEGEVPKQI